MNILPSTGTDPVGAAALLGYADPEELARFNALEDAVWSNTTLAPAVIEAVRLHCAQVRGCEFCKAVRVTAAIEDGLSEDHVGRLGKPEDRSGLGATQIAALTVADHFLLDPKRPDQQKSAEIAAFLGTAGIMEVLLACSAFASAELRIALGENTRPYSGNVFERARGNRTDPVVGTAWPVLDGSVLDPANELPAVAPEVAGPIRERVAALWSGKDIPSELVAACVIRSAQLRGVTQRDASFSYLVPSHAATLADHDDVRNWPDWPDGKNREILALAEQVWIDPASVDSTHTDPLSTKLGVDSVIRVTWNLILIGQLHRVAMVLHHDQQ